MYMQGSAQYNYHVKTYGHPETPPCEYAYVFRITPFGRDRR